MKGLLFTYALTVGGSVGALFSPFFGLLVYVCFAIVKPDQMWFWAVPQGNYSRLVGCALLLGWILHGCGNWKLGRARFVILALVGYWLWGALAALQAPDQTIAWRFVESVSKIVLPCLVGITTIDSVRKLKQLAWVIVASHGYIALELNLTYLEGYNRVWMEGFGGLDNNSVAIAMVTALGLAVFLGLAAESWWLKGVAFACALLTAHVVLLSFSRSGMLAMIITGIVGFTLLRKTVRHYLAFGLFVLVALYLAGPEVRARFQTTFGTGESRDASAQSRLDLWRDCLDVMAKHPVFGVGPDHWQLVAHEYGWPPGKLAHSLWLQIGAEIGIVGLAFLMTYYLACAARLWGVLRRSDRYADPWLTDAARMVIASLVGFFVSAQFVSLDRLEAPYYVALLGAGALKLASMETVADAPSDWRTAPEGAAWSSVSA